jgi:mono/diheme cytochrome c family protein
VCHALDGNGGIGLNIAGGSNTALSLSDEQIAGVITVGPGNMPGFSRLTPEQVNSLVTYVRSLE